MSPIQKRRIGWVLMTVVSTLVLSVALAMWGLVKRWNAQILQISEVTSQVHGSIGEDLVALRELNDAYQGRPCDKEILERMRVAEFHAHFLHEFGYLVDGQLVCTTTTGLLSEPIPQADRDVSALNSDVLFAPDDPVTCLNGEETAMRVRVGAFQALIRPVPDLSGPISWLQVGIFSFTDQGWSGVYGTSQHRPSTRAPVGTRSFRYANGYWISENYYSSRSCEVIGIDIAAFFRDEQATGLVLLICILLVTCLSGAWSWLIHKRLMALPRQLRRGLSEKRIKCLYQPILSLKTGKFDHCEVLCHWSDEQGNWISPDVVIRIIEKNGQTRQLTELVLKKAVAELTHFGLLGQIHFAVNVFPDDISSGHAERMIAKYLGPENNHLITLEVTEREVESMDEVAKGIERLRRQSVRIAIDDFGTGYSNFQHLDKLQVDYLKIDKSFVLGLKAGMIRGILVNYIVDMAKNLNLPTMAEGVEEEYQLAQLRKLGVDYSQGYLHAKPLAIEELAKFVGAKSAEHLKVG